MGNFEQKIKITSLDDKEFKRSVELSAHVDNGASFTQIPRKILERLKIEPVYKKTFILADGTHIERDIGLAFVKVLDEIAACEVCFGEENDATLLGNSAMQLMGILIDPQNEKLIRRGYLLQY